MSSFQDFMIAMQDPYLLGAAIAIVLVAIALGVWLWMRYYRQPLRHVQRRLARAGHARLRGVLLPDGMDGHIHVDYLILTADGISVLSVKDYRGMLVGSERIDHWTQILGRRSYPFANPLFELQDQLAAVRGIVPKIPVDGCVVFTASGAFLKRVPEGVCLAATLDERFGAARTPPPGLLAAWDQLKRVARPLGEKT